MTIRNNNTRGTEAVLTRPIKMKSRDFKSKYLRGHDCILPFMIVAGLKKPIRDYDTMALAEHFMLFAHEDAYQPIRDELWDFAECISNPSLPADKVMEILYAGSHKVNYENFDSLYEGKTWELFRKYKPHVLTLNRYILNGYSEANWYSDTLLAFKRHLVGYDIELFVKLFAMTSPRTNFKANLRSAIRAYELHENGKSFEKQGFLPATVAMVNDFRSGKLDFKEEYRDGRRKIVHFANAILGKKDAVVVDSWMMRAYGLTQEYKWRDKILPYKPRITEYDLVETHIKAIAGTIFEPRQIVAMIWSGIRKFDVSYQKVDTDSLLREVLTK